MTLLVQRIVGRYLMANLQKDLELRELLTHIRVYEEPGGASSALVAEARKRGLLYRSTWELTEAGHAFEKNIAAPGSKRKEKEIDDDNLSAEAQLKAALEYVSEWNNFGNASVTIQREAKNSILWSGKAGIGGSQKTVNDGFEVIVDEVDHVCVLSPRSAARSERPQHLPRQLG